MNLQEASIIYLDQFPTTTSKETLRLYKRGCEMFIDIIGSKDVKQVSELDFETYCQQLTKDARRNEWSPRTQHAYTRGVVGLLIYLAEMKLSDKIFPQTLWRIRKKRVAKVIKEPYKLPVGAAEFAENVYSQIPPPPAAKKEYQRFILEHAFASALVSSGARIHEVTGIMIKNIEGNRALVRGKGGKVGYINFTSAAMKIINKWITERGRDSIYLFPAMRGDNKTLNTETGRQILYRWITRVLGDSESEITPHTFRHLAITRGIKKMGLRWAQKQARHADPAITADYDESDADEVTDVYDAVMS